MFLADANILRLSIAKLQVCTKWVDSW